MPYQLPLTREEFARALDYGLGRALLHGLVGMEDLFLHACLHDSTFGQYDRADWLGRFFTGAPEWIAGPVYAALTTAPLEERSHLCGMALVLGRRGHPGAIPALRAAYYYDEEECVPALAEEELLELEGEAGFLWMAGRLGRWAREGRAVDLGLVEAYAGPERETAMFELMRASSDPDVRYYAEHLERKGDLRRPSVLPRRKTGEDILAVLNQLDSDVYYTGGWGRKADPADLRWLAGELFQPMALVRLRSLLRCFMGQGLPAYDARLLVYANHEDAEVRRLSYWILAHHDHEDVRALALARLGQPGALAPNALRLFRSTWRSGDKRLLLRALREVPAWDPDARHTALGDLLDVLKHNPTPAARALQLLVYEYAPSIYSRGDAVELMLSLGTLPAWARRECRHDVDEHIRELVGARK